MKNLEPWPFRYRTAEDGLKAQADLSKAKELSIPAFIEKDGKMVFNPEYENAPFELALVFDEKNTFKKGS